eukprot:CAMPEP_0206215890 /NCGR_PEP_ID=MMETSP0047_2-20121206/2433_1 /ASSEMBLY_ACC=CAM_ASM_000192 /TAXON_ID=195065 /ORGANISM="Chroomonas mesostigmatica_cf, Strain CCMP1168" /LENGTH=71 /DNA_ID=CAMNT_0053638209 /DNA_START=254 /DNA_END=465 /DNA_ORIENTATION=+
MPSSDEPLKVCSEVPLAPLYTSLVSLFTSLPLYADQRVRDMVADLTSVGDALDPPLSALYQEIGSLIPLQA